MSGAPSGAPRVVIVICDSLRADLIGPDDTPFLLELAERGAWFTAHRSVFPSTTRASAASIATGCLPARHGLLGNTMALDEGDGLICRSAGHPDFPDRLRSHGGAFEQTVPFLLSRPVSPEYAEIAGSRRLRNFDIFDFALNGAS